MRLMALVLLFMVGCTPNWAPDTVLQISIAEIHHFDVTVTETELSVMLGTVDGQHAGPCEAALPELSAQLDELDVPVVTYGGKIGEDPGDDVSDNECAAPRLGVAPPALNHRSVLRMSDHTGTVACELPDLRTARKARLVPSGPWELTSGEPVTIQWSPASDLIQDLSVRLLPRNAAGEIDGLIDIAGQIVNGDIVTFTLPEVPAGPYALSMDASTRLLCAPAPAAAELHSSATVFGVEQEIMVVR